MNRQIELAEFRLATALAACNHVICVVQLACRHPKIYQATYLSNGLGLVKAEFRVCAACGFAEEGWGCGYQILTLAHAECARDAAHAVRRGPLHHNSTFVSRSATPRKLYEKAVRAAFSPCTPH